MENGLDSVRPPMPDSCETKSARRKGMEVSIAQGSFLKLPDSAKSRSAIILSSYFFREMTVISFPNHCQRHQRFLARLLTIVAFGLLAACTTYQDAAGSRSERAFPSAMAPATPESANALSARPGKPADTPAKLGTQWGEGRESRVETISARRLTPERPDAVASINYQEAGTENHPPAGRQLNLLLAQGDIEWAIHDDADRPMPLIVSKDEARLGGTRGARYTLSFTNRSNHQYEIVATVDGLDVLNGTPGSQRNPGYVLRPYARLVIDGFRKNKDEVAAFRFAAPERAYAANTPAGDVRNIGVIGSAVFRLDLPDAPRKESLNRPAPFPADTERNFAPPPRY